MKTMRGLFYEYIRSVKPQKVSKILKITTVITDLSLIYRLLAELKFPSIKITPITPIAPMWPIDKIIQFSANTEKSIIFWSLIATVICTLYLNFFSFYVFPKYIKYHENKIMGRKNDD